MKYLKSLLVVILLLLVSGSVLAQEAEETEVPEEEKEILVDTEWVLEKLGTEGVVLVHLGGDLEDYEAKHIPSALFTTVGQLNNPDDEITGQIGTPEQVATALGNLGILATDTIILYDTSNNLSSARAYWVLKYYQHENVVIYEGGLARWEADGQEVASGALAEIEPVVYEIAEADLEIRTTGEYVVEHLDDAGVQLCDTRSADEYLGLDVRADRGGHIPGAINLEWIDTIDLETGLFKTYEELDELFTLAGFDREKEIITYCQTGVRGAHVWFVLRELLGYPNVRNYDGSWVEYGNNPDLPIEN